MIQHSGAPTLDPVALFDEFKRCGATFEKTLSFIDTFFQLRDQ